MFLCIFTNFFLVLLRKKTFLKLLLCIFTNRQKKQAVDKVLRAVYRQQHSDSLRTAYADEHFSRQKNRYFPSGASRQISHIAMQLFLQSKSQPPGLQQHSFLQISSILQPLSCSPAAFHKKTEPSAQFFPLYISSTFPGLYNPQFSSCNTKPKCLRMPAKSGSLLLSNVITGLSFSSHSRLNSISLLPRPL